VQTEPLRNGNVLARGYAGRGECADGIDWRAILAIGEVKHI
jgi:hypothetical protein